MISIDAHNDLPRAAEPAAKPTTPKTEIPNDTLEAAAAHTTERAMAHIIEASGDDEAATDATSVFLISAPILETKPEDEVPVKVKEVQIKLETKLPEDEAAEPAVLWHEAAILRPAQAPDADIEQLTTAMPVSIEPSQEEAETLAALEVPVPDAEADEDAEPATRWVVQEKAPADAQPSEQTVVWEADAAAEAAPADAADAGAGFVDSLQPGDRIAVLSRAEHPGWINQVERVEVTVVYEEHPAAEE